MPPRWTTAALLALLGLVAPSLIVTAQDAQRPSPAQTQDAPQAQAQTEAQDAPEQGDPDQDASGEQQLFAEDEEGQAGQAGQAGDTPIEAQDLVIDQTIELESGQAAFRFHAEGAGMLTLLTYSPEGQARVRLQIRDAQGDVVPGGVINANAAVDEFGPRIVVDRNGNTAGSMPGLSYITVPLLEAGDYVIELNITGNTDQAPVTLGGSWIAFEQIGVEQEAGAAVVPAVPAVPVAPLPPPVDPTEVAVEQVVGESFELEIEESEGWIKLVAEEPGTLVIVTRAGRTAVQLAAYPDGQFGNPLFRANRNRNGKPGNETMMFHAAAGSVWYIHVDANGDTPIPMRTILILDDLEPAQDE